MSAPSVLLKEPAPFVLQRFLGDFAVTYELNAYCNDPRLGARAAMVNASKWAGIGGP